MNARRSAPVLGAIVALVPLGGCHTYAPTPLAEVGPGQTVRVRMTPAAEDRLPGTVLQEPARFVEGEVVEREGEEITLAVVAGARQRGFFTEELRERVRFELGEGVEMERRELDRPRTAALLIATGAVVTAAIVQVFTGSTGGNTIDRTDQGPAASRIPLLRFRLW